MITKDNLIILVYYMNVDGMRPENILESVNNLRRDLGEKTSIDHLVSIKHYILPVRNQPTKVECIYPTMSSDKELFARATKALESIETLADLWNDRESKDRDNQ